jgi:hypothetical protein
MSTRSNLAELETLGLLHVAADSEEAAYMFRHALIQDAAYASLVKKDRQRLNLMVGETLERLYTDRVEQIAPRLAQHFDSAGDDSRALKYFKLAGDQAKQVYANAEAAVHYRRAIDAARQITALPNASQVLLDLYLQHGQALHSSADWQGALDNFVELQRFAVERGDRTLEMHSLIEQAMLRAIFGPLMNSASAIELSQAALTIARELNQHAIEARILWVLMRATVEQGRSPQQALEYGTQSLALARELNLSEQLAYTLNDIQYAYREVGQPARALTALHEARELWRANGNQHMLADNLGQAALIDLYRGELETAQQSAQESAQVSAASANLVQMVLSHFTLGLIQLERGEINAAWQLLSNEEDQAVPTGKGMIMMVGLMCGELGQVDRGIQLVENLLRDIRGTGLMAIFGAGVLGTLAKLKLMQNNLLGAQQLISQAQQLMGARTLLTQFLGGEQMLMSEIEVKLAEGESVAAAQLADQLLEQVRRYEVRRLLPGLLRLKSRALAAQNKIDEAVAGLIEAQAQAAAVGAHWGVWAILIDLYLIEMRRDNFEEARRWQAAAQEEIQYILDRCPIDLKTSFLNLPDIQAIGR